jgi:VIT1/CCC1 family predicted Fe2+/Mn2+ transporter
MAAGEYVSMAAQTELLERELAIERRSLREDPDYERQELAGIYEARGLSPEAARRLSNAMMQDEDVALEVHAREEIGIDPGRLGSPYGAAASSFLAFSAGGLLQLLPWFFMEGDAAVGVSVAIATVAALGIGAAVGLSTGKGVVRSALRQLGIGALAGAVTFAVGAVLGVQVT